MDFCLFCSLVYAKKTCSGNPWHSMEVHVYCLQIPPGSQSHSSRKIVPMWVHTDTRRHTPHTLSFEKGKNTAFLNWILGLGQDCVSSSQSYLSWFLCHLAVLIVSHFLSAEGSQDSSWEVCTCSVRLRYCIHVCSLFQLPMSRGKSACSLLTCGTRTAIPRHFGRLWEEKELCVLFLLLMPCSMHTAGSDFSLSSLCVSLSMACNILVFTKTRWLICLRKSGTSWCYWEGRMTFLSCLLKRKPLWHQILTWW